MNRTHTDHHSGTGVSTVSGVGAMRGATLPAAEALPLPRHAQ